MAASPDPLAAVADDPETVQFLASALTTFMRVERPARGRWTKRRVATAISTSETVPGTVGDTTLGRFLDPEDPQEPSLETVRAVAAWLVERRWIDPRDLVLFGAAAHLRQLSELVSFFGVPDTPAQGAFLDDLAGAYGGLAADGRFAALHRLHLRRVPDLPGLVARETLRVFDIGPGSGHWLPDPPALADLFRLPRAIEALGGRERAALRHAGVMAAGPGIAVALLRSETAGFASVVTLDAIAFADDRIAALQGGRRSGWQALETGEFIPPPSLDPSAGPLAVARHLSGRIDLEKYPTLRRRRPQLDLIVHDSVISNDIVRNFIGMTGIDPEQNAEEIEKRLETGYLTARHDGLSPDEQLLLALDWRRLDHFRALLRAGADSNTVRPGAPLPLVFEIASTGEPAWIDALIASGRLDLSRRDARGMPPSFHAGLAAREAVLFGDTDEAARYGAIHDALLAEEHRQARRPAPSPHP